MSNVVAAQINERPFGRNAAKSHGCPPATDSKLQPVHLVVFFGPHPQYVQNATNCPLKYVTDSLTAGTFHPALHTLGTKNQLPVHSGQVWSPGLDPPASLQFPAAFITREVAR